MLGYTHADWGSGAGSYDVSIAKIEWETGRNIVLKGFLDRYLRKKEKSL